MKDLKSIFSLNGTNYHDLDNSDKLLFDKLVNNLRDDFRIIQLNIDDYFNVTRNTSGEFSFESSISDPLLTKIWLTLVDTKSNNIL